jgi:orotate phosphoribosyltransferase-like protein
MRRSKVVEMRARGMTHQEIAHELQVSRTAITSDIQYLRSQAKVDSALHYIRNKQQEQQQSKKYLSLDSTDDGDHIDDSTSQLTKEGRQTVF